MQFSISDKTKYYFSLGLRQPVEMDGKIPIDFNTLCTRHKVSENV